MPGLHRPSRRRDGEAGRAPRGQWLAIALIVVYLLTLLDHGHVVVPAGFVIFPVVFGPFAEPGVEVGAVLGWVGTGIMFLRVVVPAEPPLWVDLAGVALLAGSLSALGEWSGNPELLRRTGLPFGAVALALLGHGLWAAFAPRRS